MLLILILWVALIIHGISTVNRDNRIFNIEQTLALRGIAAIEIMIGHIGLSTGSIWLYPNRKAGILFVGIFFMLSGYGVAFGEDHKDSYLKKFLQNRILKLFVPAYLAYVLFVLIQFINAENINLYDVINVAKFGKNLNWYVWEQLFFYLIYWLGSKLIPIYKEYFVTLCSILLIILAFTFKLDNPWYGSSLCFVLGMYYYKFEKRKFKFDVVAKWLRFGIFSIILGISMAAFFLLGNESIIGNPIARNVASASFCIMVILVLKEMKIGNRVSEFLGTCSYEIFLIHPFILVHLEKLIQINELLYGILVIFVTIIISYVLHKVSEKILKKLIL